MIRLVAIPTNPKNSPKIKIPEFNIKNVEY